MRPFSLLARCLLAGLSGALLLPAAARADAGACRYLPIATIALRGSGPVRQPTVDGAIDGQPVVMMFDTGAYTSMLMLHAAERLKLNLNQTDRMVGGVAGSTREYIAKIKDISLGDAHSGRASIRVLGATGMGQPFDAILGADFAMQMDLELNFAERKLRFFRANGCADTNLGYWDKDAMEVPLLIDAAYPDTPGIEVFVNGVRLLGIIDTGATHTTLTRAAAERAGLRVGSPGVVASGLVKGIGSADVASWDAMADSFSIGGETIRNGTLSIRDAPPGGSGHSPDLLIGADFLRAHRVLIARSQQRLYVTYLGGEVFPARAPPRASRAAPARN